MINYNILGKIMDKMALEKWKDRVDNINQEYHNIFILKKDALRSYFPQCGKCCNFNLKSTIRAYNYRFNKFEYSIHIHHQYFLKCKTCDNVVINSRMLDILCSEY